MQTPTRPFSQIKGLQRQSECEREEIEMQSWVHINDEWFSAAPAASVPGARCRNALRRTITSHRELLCGKVLGARSLPQCSSHTFAFLLETNVFVFDRSRTHLFPPQQSQQAERTKYIFQSASSCMRVSIFALSSPSTSLGSPWKCKTVWRGLQSLAKATPFLLHNGLFAVCDWSLRFWQKQQENRILKMK